MKPVFTHKKTLPKDKFSYYIYEMRNTLLFLFLVTPSVAAMQLGNPDYSPTIDEYLTEHALIKQAERKRIEMCRQKFIKEKKSRQELMVKIATLYNQLNQPTKPAGQGEVNHKINKRHIVATFEESFDILIRPGALLMNNECHSSTCIELTPDAIISLSNLFMKKIE